MYTVVVGAANNLNVFRIETACAEVDSPRHLELKLDDLKPGPPVWSNYVKGVLANYPGLFKSKMKQTCNRWLIF